MESMARVNRKFARKSLSIGIKPRSYAPFSLAAIPMHNHHSPFCPLEQEKLARPLHLPWQANA
jgi:hypothetical protein